MIYSPDEMAGQPMVYFWKRSLISVGETGVSPGNRIKSGKQPFGE
jgi:hypothetical protein